MKVTLRIRLAEKEFSQDKSDCKPEKQFEINQDSNSEGEKSLMKSLISCLKNAKEMFKNFDSLPKHECICHLKGKRQGESVSWPKAKLWSQKYLLVSYNPLNSKGCSRAETITFPTKKKIILAQFILGKDQLSLKSQLAKIKQTK